MVSLDVTFATDTIVQSIARSSSGEIAQMSRSVRPSEERRYHPASIEEISWARAPHLIWLHPSPR
jgi:hypothetical protein